MTKNKRISRNLTSRLRSYHHRVSIYRDSDLFSYGYGGIHPGVITIGLLTNIVKKGSGEAVGPALGARRHGHFYNDMNIFISFLRKMSFFT